MSMSKDKDIVVPGEVEILVTLQIDRLDGAREINRAIEEVAALSAVSDACKFFNEQGFAHPFADRVCVGLRDVEVHNRPREVDRGAWEISDSMLNFFRAEITNANRADEPIEATLDEAHNSLRQMPSDILFRATKGEVDEIEFETELVHLIGRFGRSARLESLVGWDSLIGDAGG